MEEPLVLITHMIEGDLLDFVGNLLPIGGEDIMDTLGIDPGPEVGTALERARELYESGIRDREQLLLCLREEQSCN